MLTTATGKQIDATIRFHMRLAQQESLCPVDLAPAIWLIHHLHMACEICLQYRPTWDTLLESLLLYFSFSCRLDVYFIYEFIFLMCCTLCSQYIASCVYCILFTEVVSGLSWATVTCHLYLHLALQVKQPDLMVPGHDDQLAEVFTNILNISLTYAVIPMCLRSTVTL